MLIGSVSSSNKGRMTALTIPSTIAAIRAVPKSDTRTPGNK